MKFYLIGLLAFLFPFTASAQIKTAKVQWADQPADKGFYFFGGIQDGSVISVLTGDSGKIQIDRYENDLVNKKPVAAFAGQAGEECFLVLPVKEGVFRMNQSRVERDHRVSLLTVQDKKVVSQNQENETLLPGNKFSDLFYLYSPDHSYVMVYTVLFNKKENGNEWHFFVYSTATGSMINKGIYSVSYSAAILEDVRVSVEGHALFISKKYRNAMDAVKNRNPQHEIKIFQNSRLIGEQLFSISGYDIGGVNFTDDPKGAMFLSGSAYPPGEKAGSLKGRKLFLYRMDLSKAVFTDSLLVSMESLYPDGKISRNDDIPAGLKQIHYTASGDIILLAEQQQLIIGTAGNYWRSNDLLCFRLNSKGETKSTIRIPRRQDSNNQLTFFSFVKGENVYLLYGDHKQNLDVNNQEVQPFSGNASRNGMFLLQVQADGAVHKQLLAEYGKPENVPNFYRCHDMEGNRVFLGMNRGFGILTIE